MSPGLLPALATGLALIGWGLAANGIARQDTPSLLLTPDAPAFSTPAPPRAVVRLETSRGVIDIEVIREWAPHGQIDSWRSRGTATTTLRGSFA